MKRYIVTEEQLTNVEYWAYSYGSSIGRTLSHVERDLKEKASETAKACRAVEVPEAATHFAAEPLLPRAKDNEFGMSWEIPKS